MLRHLTAPADVPSCSSRLFCADSEQPQGKCPGGDTRVRAEADACWSHVQTTNSANYWSLLNYLFDRECSVWAWGIAPADNTMLTLLAFRYFTTSGVFSLPPLHSPLFQQRMEQIPRASLTCASLSGLPIFPLAVSIFGIFWGHTLLRADAAHGCRFEFVIDGLLTKTTLPCTRAVYSFDDTSGDTSLSNFNINKAPSYLYSVLNDIRSINNVLRIHILPWSPVRLQAQLVWA